MGRRVRQDILRFLKRARARVIRNRTASAKDYIDHLLSRRSTGDHDIAGVTKPKERLMANAIQQEVVFKASATRVYEALLDAKQFSEFSNAPAEISRDLGGAFSCFGGIISGRNIELLPNRRIVQAWRVAMWPEGLYSIVRFELQED